jgi:acetyl-CoA carboxylase biotin carboxylase subunit
MKTISSLLIANRGEIAIRLMASAKKMGIKTYAIKTAKEPKALYLRFADEIIDLTEQEDEIPEFLDVHKLVNTAKQHGIDAIHPGYGFLSENPYFAEKCAEEGIVFVGPSAESIFRMGNKTIAKQIAKNMGYPCLKAAPEA